MPSHYNHKNEMYKKAAKKREGRAKNAYKKSSEKTRGYNDLNRGGPGGGCGCGK